MFDGIIPNNRKIIGYRQSADMKIIDKVATQGPNVLRDFRRLVADYGIPGTTIYGEEMLGFE
jgi:hypothetical protein